jgi:hypothetical protein
MLFLLRYAQVFVMLVVLLTHGHVFMLTPQRITLDGLAPHQLPMQPALTWTVPDGATHWAHALANPFFKVEITACDPHVSSSLGLRVICGDRPHFTPLPENAVFQKIDDVWYMERRHQYLNGEWSLSIPEKRRHKIPFCFEIALAPLVAIEHPKNARTVETTLGKGVILGREKLGGRFVVDLEDNTLHFRPCCLFPHEILSNKTLPKTH